MAGERGLQLRDFQERLLGSAELLLAVYCEMTGSHLPDFVQLVFVLLQHKLILLRQQLQLLGIQLLLDGTRLILSIRRCPTVVSVRTASTSHTTMFARRHCSPRLVEHALALLDLPHEPYLHHGALVFTALRQRTLQRPNDALPVCLDCFRSGLLKVLLWTLCSYGSSSRPSSQCAQALLCPLPHRQLRYCALPHPLRLAEDVDRISQLSQRLFRLGVNLVTLRIVEVLRVFVRSRNLLSPWRWYNRKVALPYRLEIRVKLRDVCALLQLLLALPSSS